MWCLQLHLLKDSAKMGHAMDFSAYGLFAGATYPVVIQNMPMVS
jgi:hypothetical protein